MTDQPIPPSPQAPQEPNQDLQDITGLDENRMYAALSYVGVLVLVPLLVKRDDPYVNFHARQGLVILIGFIISLIAVSWFQLVGTLLFVLLLIGDVVALVMALQGRKWKIPLLGSLASQFRI